jgi:putative hydrolase of the HAD superfamily
MSSILPRYDPDMAFRAVLFDAAETLFTTRGSVGQIYGSIARQYGSTASDDAIQAAFARQFRGAGPLSVQDQKRWWKDVVHRVFTEVGMVHNFDKFFDQLYDRFRDSKGWTLFPETTEVLAELKSRSLKLGVISNFDNRAYSVLRSLEILHFFDAVTLSSETGYCKPDREIFDAAVRALGTPASEVLLVGDSLQDDIEAGIRAGLAAVLIDRRNRHATVSSIRRISSLRDLMSLIGPSI